MKQYTGIANARPDSRTPRRFITVSTTIAPTATFRSYPSNTGRTAERYWLAADTDTATVST